MYARGSITCNFQIFPLYKPPNWAQRLRLRKDPHCHLPAPKNSKNRNPNIALPEQLQWHWYWLWWTINNDLSTIEDSRLNTIYPALVPRPRCEGASKEREKTFERLFHLPKTKNNLIIFFHQQVYLRRTDETTKNLWELERCWEENSLFKSSISHQNFRQRNLIWKRSIKFERSWKQNHEKS